MFNINHNLPFGSRYCTRIKNKLTTRNLQQLNIDEDSVDYKTYV